MFIKTQVVLHLYDSLNKGEVLTTKQIISTYEISIPTVRRYISEINAYFANFQIAKIIFYSKENEGYVLKNT